MTLDLSIRDNPVVPAGYRLLTEGEQTRRDDIYWADRWYTVGETMELVAWTAELYGPMARKVE